MSENEVEIIKSEMKEYVSGWGRKYSEWCVGVTENAKQRLFGDYHVNEKNDAWIYRTASSSNIARKIELYFIDIGAKSDPRTKNEYTEIYLYKV
ncbi:MAG: hypothetical protein HYR87_07595 [Thaumarchaeota archaeon]|nr:hypothetical protein [Nitrososphaerota archaeon]